MTINNNNNNNKPNRIDHIAKKLIQQKQQQKQQQQEKQQQQQQQQQPPPQPQSNSFEPSMNSIQQLANLFMASQYLSNNNNNNNIWNNQNSINIFIVFNLTISFSFICIWRIRSDTIFVQPRNSTSSIDTNV